jgi:hypothetical protein
MILVDRPDARRVRGLHFFRALIPYVMGTRAGSAVWLTREIDVEPALAWLKERKAAEPDVEWSLFSLVLAAGVRTFALKRQLNDYVHRHALYRRDRIAFSFIVKPNLSEASAETAAKVVFEPWDDARAVALKVQAAVASVRAGKPSLAEPVMDVLHRVPGLKGIGLGAYRLLDALNLAPAELLRADPLQASAVFANLGSIGLDAPVHHLYEWGSTSVFVSVGRIAPRWAPGPDGKPVRRRHLGLTVTVDERIADGVYFAHAAALFQRLLRRPELLESPPSGAGTPDEGAVDDADA